MRSSRRFRVAPVVAVSAAVVVAAATLGGQVDLLAGTGLMASVALAFVAVRVPAGDSLLAGQVVPLSIGVAVLSLSGAGLQPADAQEPWSAIGAAMAYPFLGHAIVRMVAANRQIREADVLVEAALVGTAVGIVLHAGMSAWRVRTFTSAWADATMAMPAVLVALDAALLVVAVRGLRAPGARRGPLGCLHVCLLALCAAHLLQQLDISRGLPEWSSPSLLAGFALLAVAVAALHPAARQEPDRLLEQPALFSTAHASVVVVALLAAPGVLAAEALRGVTVSATVATGMVLSGTILAGYLVGLLRERAATEHDATHDALTRLPNRTLLVDRLDRSIAHARRNDTSCAVLFLDLDRFKEINDTFGHAAGDDLLRSVAGRLRSCVRDEDTVARLAGDEFVILLPFLSTPDEVLTVAQRVLEALGQPITVAEERMLLAASIGIAVYPNDGATADEVLASADAAMYRAKENPGNSYEVFSPQLATQALVRLHVEAGLLDGLGRDELVLHYQPIVDLPSGRTVGAEALVRWNHPERGFLLPGHFVPVAEQSDLIVMLGEKVIFDACKELRRWEDLGLGDRFISVNVSSRQFAHGLVSTVTSALRATGANPANLVIELTESTVVDNLDAVALALAELRDIGVCAAIDDFGTGYCGLRYLSVLPVASLKIDQSFIQGMTPSAAAIVGATIAMGHSLGLTLVAEGVETQEQRRFLVGQGCDRVQGYLLGRPMPADELVNRVRAEAHLSIARASAVPAPAAAPTRPTSAPSLAGSARSVDRVPIET